MIYDASERLKLRLSESKFACQLTFFFSKEIFFYERKLNKERKLIKKSSKKWTIKISIKRLSTENLLISFSMLQTVSSVSATASENPSQTKPKNSSATKIELLHAQTNFICITNSFHFYKARSYPYRHFQWGWQAEYSQQHRHSTFIRLINLLAT